MFCTVADVIAEVLVLSSNPALWAWWAMQHGLHSCLQSSNLSLFAGFQSSAGGCYRTWPRKCWHEGGSPVSNGVTILTIGHPRPSRSRMPRSFLLSHQLPEKAMTTRRRTATVATTMYVNSAICLPFELHLTCIACSYVHTVLFELRCTISNLLPCPIELLVEQ